MRNHIHEYQTLSIVPTLVRIMDGPLNHVQEGIILVDEQWCVTDLNAAAESLLNESSGSLIDSDFRDEFPTAVNSPLAPLWESDLQEQHEFEEYFPELNRWLDGRVIPLDDGIAVYLRDVSQQRRRDDQLVAQRRNQEILTRINGIIREIIRDLSNATTRTEIERTVCERLAATQLYEFAWIGEQDPIDNQLSVNAVSGNAGKIIDRLTEWTADNEGGSSIPEMTAIRTGESRVTDQLAGDESIPEPVRRATFARGLQSNLSTPLAYGNRIEGVLAVYSTRADAFSEPERFGFEALGEIIGFSIRATQQQNLLLSDTVIELMLRVSDPKSCLVCISERFDVILNIEGIVPIDRNSLLLYVSVIGGTSTDILDTAASWEAVKQNRIVDEYETGALLELTLDGASPVLKLAERGATVRTATYEDGTGHITAEMSPDADIRSVIEEIGEAFSESELVAKREQERDVETAQQFRTELIDQLTERQRTVLRTAYFGEYFESPRGSTAEELAQSLGITSPTFHHHLRAAQRKLLHAFINKKTAKRDESKPLGVRTDSSRLNESKQHEMR